MIPTAAAPCAPLTPLGIALFPEVPPQNRLPIGGGLVFSSDALNNFLVTSLNAGKTSVTIVAGLVHDGKVPINDWKNFNYLFVPKEHMTLNADVGYDSDTTDPNNPLGSPWSAASNAEDASGFSPFSPHLIFGPTGDFNFDGTVNTADYVIWRKTDGSAAGYNTWRSNYGKTGVSGAGLDADSTVVPEPRCALLLTSAATIASCRRRRFRFHAS